MPAPARLSPWRRFRRKPKKVQALAWVGVFILLSLLGQLAPSSSTPGKTASEKTTVPTSPPTTAMVIDSDATAVAAGMVALCQDGNYSDNTDFGRTCNKGGGLSRWLAGFGQCDDGTTIVMKTNSSCDNHGGFDRVLPGFTPSASPKDIARCANGLYSDNVDLGATCSANEGVAEWLSPYGRCVDGTVIRMGTSASCDGHDGFSVLEAATFEPAAGQLDVARCSDGTFSANRNLKKTCDSQGGVATWLAEYGQCIDGKIVRLGAENCGSARLAALLPGYVPPATTTVATTLPAAPPTPTSGESVPADADVSVPLSPEILDTSFVVLMELYGLDPQLAKAAAQEFCAAIDSNGGDVARTFTQAAVVITIRGIKPELFGAVIGAGVPAYCPQYSEALDALAGR